MRIILGKSSCDYLIHRQGSGDTWEIFDLAVKSERGVGIGRSMVEQLLSELPNDVTLVYAITRKSNRIAQEFYKALGFRLIGVLTRFYGDEDAAMYGVDR